MAVQTPETREEQDSAYNPVKQHALEQFPSAYSSAGTDQAEAFANDPKNHDNPNANINTVKDQENNPSYSGFYNPSGKKRDKKTIINLKNLKKRSPIIAIIIGLFGGIIGIGGLASPALLLIHIEENFVNKYDSQNTSMTIRANKLIVKKISADATSGVCGKVQIVCKFTRPSSTLLKNLSKNGIQAVDGNGKIIDPKSWVNPFPNTQPKSYQFTDSTGKLTTVSAANFSNELNTNSEFRAAFHKAYNPRFIGYSDSVFKTIETRFGFSKSSTTKDAKTSDEVKAKINDDVKGGSAEAKAAAASGDSVAAEGVAKKLISTELTTMLEKLSKTGKGSGISMGIGLVCLATDLPGMITATARAFQMAQVITYAFNFLNTASAMKAGDASPQQVAGLGSLLTTVVAGKSAMDSFGMKYSLFGDTAPSDNNYKKFSPGGSVMTDLGGIVNVTSSTQVRQSCSVATSPEAAGAINAGLVLNSGETLGATAAIAALNIGAGFAIEGIMSIVGPQIIDAGLNLIGPQAIQAMLGSAFGDITKDTSGKPVSGESVGDLVASGASNMMGQTANAGGNMPLSVDEAIAYNNESQQVQLAYAQEDRSTLSPLDPTSSSTFLGSIVNKLLPYYSKTASLTGILSNIASLTAGSFSSLFNVSAMTVDRAQYSLCDDPVISANDIAAGPFCNIYYGIPNQYIEEDPLDVVNYMVNNNEIDGNTGDPITDSDYADWLTLCTDGTASQADGCQIRDDQHAKFSLYTIDHRIQKTMDGEDNTDTSTTSATAGNMIDQDSLYLDSTTVACAPGTIDAGIGQGYYQKKEINIRLCSIPNAILMSGQPVQVNSRVSGAFLALAKALAASRSQTVVKVTDGFRTMSQQTSLYQESLYGGGNLAAAPGLSNHQMGLAVDFQMLAGNSQNLCKTVAGTCQLPGDPIFDWLHANAAQYGLRQYSKEYWHWEPTKATD